MAIEIDDNGEFVTRLGMTEDDIASAARNSFLGCLGVDRPEWDKCSNNTKEHWRDAINVLLEPVRLEMEIRWASLARKMAFAHHREDRWEELPDLYKVAWEVASREGVNRYLAEDADDLREIDDMDWMSWAVRRLNPEKEGVS